MATQSELDRVKNAHKEGRLTTEQANVELVKTRRVELVTCPIPREVRKHLNNAVKAGELGHMKKDGLKPECYFYKPFEYLARAKRAEYEQNILRACGAVFAGGRIV